MAPQITYGILADGGTDRVLEPIISWTIRQIHPEVEILEPEFAKRHGTLADALRAYPIGPMLVFAHRDAETAGYEARLREFADVEDDRVVPVIPVKMTEAWLLIDAEAIGLAVGRPSARVTLPKISELENLADPKNHLESLLVEAAGNPTGRHRKRLRQKLTTYRVSVASRIRDFSPLRNVESFSSFVDHLVDRYPYGR